MTIRGAWIAGTRIKTNCCAALVLVTNHRYDRGTGVGRILGVGPVLGVGLGLGVEVAVAVGVAVGVEVAVAVAVEVGVGVDVAEAVAVAVAVGVGVGVPPAGAWIATIMGEPVLKKPTVALAACGG